MCGDQNISFRKPIKAMLENVADIDGQVGFLESTGPLLDRYCSFWDTSQCVLPGAALSKPKKGSWHKYVQFILLKLTNQISGPILVKPKPKHQSPQSIPDWLKFFWKDDRLLLIGYICEK